MSYLTEFPTDFAVPAVFATLTESGVLEDHSWHNDTMPSFIGRQLTGGLVRVWVDHIDPSMREWDQGSRFSVFSIDEEGEVIVDEPLLATDDLVEVLALFGH